MTHIEEFLTNALNDFKVRRDKVSFEITDREHEITKFEAEEQALTVQIEAAETLLDYERRKSS